jgi:hypothetical protein
LARKSYFSESGNDFIEWSAEFRRQVIPNDLYEQLAQTGHAMTTTLPAQFEFAPARDAQMISVSKIEFVQTAYVFRLAF